MHSIEPFRFYSAVLSDLLQISPNTQLLLYNVWGYLYSRVKHTCTLISPTHRMLSASEAHAFIYLDATGSHNYSHNIVIQIEGLFNYRCLSERKYGHSVTLGATKPETAIQLHRCMLFKHLFSPTIWWSLAASCSLWGGWLSLHKSFLFRKQSCVSFINSEIQVCYT